MVFSSILFVFTFLPLTLAVYYFLPRFLKNFALLSASLVFYAWGEPVYILIMIFSTIFDYANGLLIRRLCGSSPNKARLVLIGSICVNIGILCFFKYYGFIIHNINNLTGLTLPELKLPLPVGISFYTFQTMSYVIDVYLGKVPVQRNIIAFGTYITMFPQLIAGPIIRYGDIAGQLEKRQESIELFGEGTEIFIRGLAKKVLLANNIGLLWDSIKASPMEELTVLSAWLGILAFTFQIYFDFSGYSDMAVGLGKMFGFDLMRNFNYPYISKNITEFWRRWHISLSSWFREYVYIPLGGNRKGWLKQYRNLLVVWFLTGLWHGANWNFVLWGLYFCAFLILEKLFLARWLESMPGIISHIYTLLVVIVSWVLFEFEKLSQCAGFIGAMFGFAKAGLYNRQALYYLYTHALLFIVLAVCSTPFTSHVITTARSRMGAAGNYLIPAFYMLLAVLSTSYLVNESYNPFLYFRF